jgi:hypothetical protein
MTTIALIFRHRTNFEIGDYYHNYTVFTKYESINFGMLMLHTHCHMHNYRYNPHKETKPTIVYPAGICSASGQVMHIIKIQVYF